jgi:hypothetical protein
MSCEESPLGSAGNSVLADGFTRHAMTLSELPLVQSRRLADFFQMEINTAQSRKASYFNYKGRNAVAQASGKNQILCAACFFRSRYRRARSAALRLAASLVTP